LLEKRRSIEKLYLKNYTNNASQYGLQNVSQDNSGFPYPISNDETKRYLDGREYHAYKHGVALDTPNKIRHYNELPDESTFDINITSKTIWSNEKVYNTPNPKSENRPKNSTPWSSSGSRSKLVKRPKISEKFLSSDNAKHNELLPLMNSDCSKGAKFNAMISTDISAHLEVRNNTKNENFNSIKSGTTGKYILKDTEETSKCSEYQTNLFIPALIPQHSQNVDINKWDMSISRYKKNALSKRRQHSSYKTKEKDLSKIWDDLPISHSNKNSKRVLSDEKGMLIDKNKNYDINRQIWEDFKQKQEINWDKYAKKNDLVELVPLSDDRIVTCKTKIEKSENQQLSKHKEPEQISEDSYKEKPWIVYLRTLRIPIICPIHRKLFIMIQSWAKRSKLKQSEEPNSFSRGSNSILFNKNNIENSTSQGNDSPDSKSKKPSFNSFSSMKKSMNRNPNCNHNNSQFYNSWLVSVKFDRDSNLSNGDDKGVNNDLLWKNGELYSEREELSALSAVLYKLFSNPRLGENINDKKRSKVKTIAGK